MKIKNLISFPIPNIIKLVEIITNIFDINEVVNIAPLKMKMLDKNAYVTKNVNSYTIFVNNKHLNPDKLTPFIIKLFIHELWHIKQMAEGKLKIDGSVYTWDGKDFIVKKDDEYREWESEARQAELTYYKQVKELLKN